MTNAHASVEIHDEWGIVNARQSGRQFAKDAGFGNVDQARIATAVSELARNIYLYAGQGEIAIDALTEGSTQGVQITANDQGPGIADIRKALEDGFTSSGGLGAGLPGVKRLMNDFTIDSTRDEGTRIVAVKWLAAAASPVGGRR